MHSVSVMEVLKQQNTLRNYWASVSSMVELSFNAGAAPPLYLSATLPPPPPPPPPPPVELAARTRSST